MTERTYTLDELCNLTGLSKRTIRYYIQMGLVDRPEGEKRTAFYLTRHLESLLRIKRLSAQGMSLEKIRQGGDEVPQTELKSPEPGTVEVCSHVFLASGIELVINPAASGLDSEAIRQFVRGAVGAIEALKSEKKNN